MAEWSPEEKVELKRLWAEGHSASEIGRRMGRSKNSVLGRVHRMGLPSRTSPVRIFGFTPEVDARIRQLAAEGYSAIRIGQKIGAGETTVLKRFREMGIVRERAVRAPKVTLPGLRVVASKAEPVLPPEPRKPRGQCCWPMWGHREKPNGRFCTNLASRGSFCSEHGAQAYRGVGGEAQAA